MPKCATGNGDRGRAVVGGLRGHTEASWPSYCTEYHGTTTQSTQQDTQTHSLWLVSVCSCVCVSMCMCMHVHQCVCACVHVHMCVCVCVCACVCVYSNVQYSDSPLEGLLKSLDPHPDPPGCQWTVYRTSFCQCSEKYDTQYLLYAISLLRHTGCLSQCTNFPAYSACLYLSQRQFERDERAELGASKSVQTSAINISGS
jgi:hypothetical protein